MTTHRTPTTSKRRQKPLADRGRVEIFDGRRFEHRHFDDLSEIAKPIQREKALRAIATAGFTAEHTTVVLGQLAEAFRWYKQGQATSRERPRASALKAELSTLADRAESMRDCLKKLSPAAKQACTDIDARPLVAYRELEKIMREYRDRAHAATLQVPRDPTGRSADSGLHDLARQFNAVWHEYGPSGKGVTRRGADDTFAGPLVPLMTTLCQIESVGRSRQVIGKALYETRSRVPN